MPKLGWKTGFFGMLLVLAGCGDSTLPDAPINALPGATAVLEEENQTSACCTEVVVVVPGPTEPACDPYLDLNGCAGSEGDCVSSSTSGSEMQGIAGCDNGDSGGPTGPGDLGGSADGTGGLPTPPGEPVEPEPGPLFWGACVLALVGSVYTIDQVGAKFEGWWAAQKEYNRAKAVYEYAWENRENLVDPSSLAIAQMRMEYALQRRNDAVEDVHELTGVSILTLGAAAVTCGPAVFAPTP